MTGARVYTETGSLPGATLAIDGSQVSDINRHQTNGGDHILRLPEDWHVVPGFIDTHIHGAAGADVMDGSDDALGRISQHVVTEGTTSFLATTMTSAPDTLDNAMRALGLFTAPADGAEMLGAHLEGPFVNVDKKGAQPAEWITPPDTALFHRWQHLASQRIKLATLAPEIEGATELIAELKQQGVRAAIGHSNCSAAVAQRAFQCGCGRVTHLFNGMSGLHHRDPGVAAAALAEPACVAEIIADGHHVATEMLRLAFQAKTSRGLIAITDAMRAKGMPDGVYDLGGQQVTVNNGMAQLDDGSLAGSVLTLDQALRNLIEATDCSLYDAIRMVSTNAAQDLGVIDRKGTLAPGKDADFVVLDAQLNVRLTVCRGRPVYDNGCFAGSGLDATRNP
ncbi:N-acetylglucosamine-6-phosphate deacetylase [Salinisphaera sp. USBA-960]|nr:N-acetylglucosamine-6-phosphate deacetylase [Salifodinibacter halophilus]NNC26135.1 N-acetylglucosamine-6-phosphate deacetylase [Salifodinibacter halophilus]